MKKRLVIGTLALLSPLILSGCARTSHPAYTILNHAATQKSEVTSAVEQANIPNLELPTKLPYSVQGVVIGKYKNKRNHFDVLFSSGASNNRYLEVVAIPSNKQQSQKVSWSQTQLKDGSKAYFHNSGQVSELAWTKNGVSYLISSGKAGKVPDLSENKLVKVADSFKWH